MSCIASDENGKECGRPLWGCPGHCPKCGTRLKKDPDGDYYIRACSCETGQ